MAEKGLKYSFGQRPYGTYFECAIALYQPELSLNAAKLVKK
jgi:hypothetical protein